MSTSIVEHRKSRQVTPYDTNSKSFKKSFIDKSIEEQIDDDIMSIDEDDNFTIIDELDVQKGTFVVSLLLITSNFLQPMIQKIGL